MRNLRIALFVAFLISATCVISDAMLSTGARITTASDANLATANDANLATASDANLATANDANLATTSDARLSTGTRITTASDDAAGLAICKTKYGVPGDTFTLTGPSATGGASYSYYWTLNPSISFIPNAQSQSITFTVPTTNPPRSITASVLVTDTRTGGCALSNCVNLVIDTSNTCSLIGTSSMATQICQTKSDPQTYQYTGTADLTKNSLAYLNWLVDGNLITSRDTTGQFSYVWSTSPYNSVGTHKVGVEVHSTKGNQVLSGPCTIDVVLLPLPNTTITPT